MIGSQRHEYRIWSPAYDAQKRCKPGQWAAVLGPLISCHRKRKLAQRKLSAWRTKHDVTGGDVYKV